MSGTTGGHVAGATFGPAPRPKAESTAFRCTIDAMRTTIDAAGRLVIPKSIRQQAGLRAGVPLDIRWLDGHIEIEPAALPVKLVREGHLLVAAPEREIPPLTNEMVEETREALRSERTGLD
mgnify:CR=1 FL=1